MIKAIVLSCDGREAFSELTVKSYNDCWPNHPFSFLIPYNNIAPKFYDKNIQYIKSKKSIKETMISLLANIDEEEFVYWCIDDRYIDKMFNLDGMIAVSEYIKKINKSVDDDAFAESIRFISRHDRVGALTKIGEQNYYKSNINSIAHGFWHHSFIKSKVLRKIFINNNISPIYTHSTLNKDIIRNNKKYSHKIYTPDKSMYRLGETTINGAVTKNCMQAFKRYSVEHKKARNSQASVFFGKI